MKPIPNVFEKMEFERRVAFLKMFEDFITPPPELSIYAIAYSAKIHEMIRRMGLSASRINKFKNIYRTLGL